MARILVVDDDTDILNTIAMLLEMEGYRCAVASNSRDALEWHQNQKFDLLVLDYRMPGVSGKEIYEKLREAGDKTPVLFLSADRDIMSRVEKSDSTVAMTKPFDINEFVKTVARLCI